MRVAVVRSCWPARAALLGLVLAAACSPRRRLTPSDAAPVEQAVLEVKNNSWSDLVIYIERDGFRTRFMMVTAGRSASQEIPPSLIGSTGTLRVIVHRIGKDDTYVSPVVSLRTGFTVELTVEQNLAGSTVAVR